MKTIEMDKATSPLAEYAQDIGEEPIIVTLGGKPVAALITLDNTDLETISLGTHPLFIKLIEQSRTRQKKEDGISSAEMRLRLEIN